jgi:hypothetical protein
MIISYKFKFGLVCVSLVISLSLLEFTLRFYRVGDDERNLLYEHHKLLGWFPQKNVSREFTGANTIQINHNSYGFRGKEFNLNTKKKKILILGDSFAYGYDSEVHERFSEILDNNLENYQIYNLGVSGYSTDQELLLLKEYYHIIEPDLVYLLYHHNDWHGNSVNHIYNGYYKPYFKLDSETQLIRLNGVPVPKSIRHLKYEYPLFYKSKIVIWLTNILYNNNIVEISENSQITFKLLKVIKIFVEQNKNADFKIGIVGNGSTPNFIEFLDNNKFDWISIDQDKDKKFFTSTGHWSKLGNIRAAKKMLDHVHKKK